MPAPAERLQPASSVLKPFLSRLVNMDAYQRKLDSARIRMSATDYLSLAFIAVSSVTAVAFALAFLISSRVPRLSFLSYSIAFLAFAVTLALISEYPESARRSYGRALDAELVYASSYAQALSIAGTPIMGIVERLASEETVRHVARECSLILSMARLGGRDIVSAIRAVARDTPGKRFGDFLQGIVNTVVSGGSLGDYFNYRAREYQEELGTRNRVNIESLGVLTESYITVGIAFPIILLIMVGIVAALSPSPSPLLIRGLYATSAIIIPAVSAVFAYLIYQTSREVSS